MLNKNLPFIIVILFSYGCAMGPQYTPISQESFSSINQTTFYNLTIQDEIRADVAVADSTAAMGAMFGLIGVLVTTPIESASNKKRSKESAEKSLNFYQATDKYNFRKESTIVFSESLEKTFKFDKQTLKPEAVWLTKDMLREKVNSLEDNQAMLYLSNFYDFTDNSKRIASRTFAYLYLKPEKPLESGEPKPDYHNKFYVQSDALGEGANESIALWANNSGEAYQRVLENNMDKISDMLIYDVNTTAKEECNVKLDTKFYTPQTKIIKNMKGKLVSLDGTNIIIRENDGALYYFNQAVINNDDLNKECINNVGAL